MRSDRLVGKILRSFPATPVFHESAKTAHGLHILIQTVHGNGSIPNRLPEDSGREIPRAGLRCSGSNSLSSSGSNSSSQHQHQGKQQQQQQHQQKQHQQNQKQKRKVQQAQQ